ncbi:hypothetical protein BJ508DRAFT_410884 [Ascobolus immersus RN42]|uniref:Uncharacterized protein n=1 Tax=Ascobolus immersus RN42 TaxID=1160509 RepID=A0A3N4IRK6_ASCIM|nr:hypothetical protein BJ508DRAFT_410884 [Ascobolus immersus RN42]
MAARHFSPVLPTYAALAPNIPLPSDLSLKRHYSQSKLRSAWEDIIQRYSDPNIPTDEVDLFSGEIVVDNGHLANLEDCKKRLDPWRPSMEDFEEGPPPKRSKTSQTHHDSIPTASFLEPPPMCDKCAEIDELEGVICTHLAREDTAERTDGNGTDAENIPPITPLRKQHIKVIRPKSSALRPKPLGELGGGGNTVSGSAQRNRGDLWKPAPDDPLVDPTWYQEGPETRQKPVEITDSVNRKDGEAGTSPHSNDPGRRAHNSKRGPSSPLQPPTTSDHVEEQGRDENGGQDDEVPSSEAETERGTSEAETVHGSEDEEEETAPPSSYMPSSPPILRRPYSPPLASSFHAQEALPARTETTQIQLCSPKAVKERDRQNEGHDQKHGDIAEHDENWNAIISEISQKSSPPRRPIHSTPPRPTRAQPSSPAIPSTPSVTDSAETTPRPRNYIPSTPPAPTYNNYNNNNTFPSSSAIRLDSSAPSTPETPTRRTALKSLIPFSVRDLHTKAPTTPLPNPKLATSDLVIPETPEENQPKPSSSAAGFETPPRHADPPPKMAALLPAKSSTPKVRRRKAAPDEYEQQLQNAHALFLDRQESGDPCTVLFAASEFGVARSTLLGRINKGEPPKSQGEPKRRRYSSPNRPAEEDVEPRSSASFAVEIPARRQTRPRLDSVPTTPQTARVPRTKQSVEKQKEKDTDFDTPVKTKRTKDVRRMSVSKKKVVEEQTAEVAEVELDEASVPSTRKKRMSMAGTIKTPKSAVSEVEDVVENEAETPTITKTKRRVSLGKKKATPRVVEAEVVEEVPQSDHLPTPKPTQKTPRRKSIATKQKATPKHARTPLDKSDLPTDTEDEIQMHRKRKEEEKERRKKRFSWVDLAMLAPSRSPKHSEETRPIETEEQATSTPISSPSLDPAGAQLVREIEGGQKDRTPASQCGTPGYHCGKLICFLCEED